MRLYKEICEKNVVNFYSQNACTCPIISYQHYQHYQFLIYTFTTVEGGENIDMHIGSYLRKSSHAEWMPDYCLHENLSMHSSCEPVVGNCIIFPVNVLDISFFLPAVNDASKAKLRYYITAWDYDDTAALLIVLNNLKDEIYPYKLAFLPTRMCITVIYSDVFCYFLHMKARFPRGMSFNIHFQLSPNTFAMVTKEGLTWVEWIAPAILAVMFRSITQVEKVMFILYAPWIIWCAGLIAQVDLQAYLDTVWGQDLTRQTLPSHRDTSGIQKIQY